MVKNIEIADVGSEKNEAPKEVEEIKEEPIINEKSKEVETNHIINEENNKVEEEEREPKQELKSEPYSTEKVECPKCKKYLAKYTFKYRHNCNGIPVKKEPDPNKVVRRKIMHPAQAKEFENNVYEKVKDNIPKVDEQEIERRVEERLKKHLETTANKVFETAKDRVEAELTPFTAALLRYNNMKVERDNKNTQKILQVKLFDKYIYNLISIIYNDY